MPSKDIMFKGWIADYAVSGGKRKNGQNRLQTEADTIEHDLTWPTMVLTSIRLVVSVFIYTFAMLFLFNSISPTTDTPTLEPVAYAIVVYVLTHFLGIVAGLPSMPSLYLCLMAPLWTLMRAKKGHKWNLFKWSLVLNWMWYGGLILLTAYLAQLLMGNIDSSANLTIPTNETVTRTVYATDLLFWTVIVSTVMWFDVLGVGGKDGAWLPWSPADNNDKRESRDRHIMAALNATGFLWNFLATGGTFPIEPIYIFATFTQHTPGNGDYAFIFGYTVGVAAAATLVMTILTFFCSDLLADIMRGLGVGRRRGRYGRSNRNNRKRASDETDDDDGETGRGGNDDDDDEDDDN